MTRKDDTPLFIRNSTVPPVPLGPGDSLIPVLEVSSKVIFWRKARWPLIILFVLVLLAAGAFITREIMIGEKIEQFILEAQVKEAEGTVKKFVFAKQMLLELNSQYPDRDAPKTALAWQLVLEAAMLGPERDLAVKAGATQSPEADVDTSLGMATRSGLLYLAGNYNAALDNVTLGLTKYPSEPRLSLVQAWTLTKLGKADEALNKLCIAMAVSPTYIPLVIVGISTALKINNNSKALELAKKLKSNPLNNYLYADIVTATLSLPKWDEEEPGEQEIAALANKVSSIMPKIDTAPPKLKSVGLYLAGRVHLLAGKFTEAVKILGQVAGENSKPEYFKWYALATKRQSGPEAALELMDLRMDAQGPEINLLRAKCLLAYYRVDSAVESVDKLRGSKEFSRQYEDLRWSLAVKSGDLDTALSTMPKSIDSAHQWLALELYYQLKNVGERKNIIRLTDAFSDELKACAKVIRKWHSKRSRAALKSIRATNKDSCINALVGNLLKGHAPPQILKKAIDETAPEVGVNLRFDVDRAMSTWVFDSFDAAKKILDEIWDLKPEAAPLRCALANAYLKMKLSKEALLVLGDLETPQALALRFVAARMNGQKNLSGLVELASSKHNEKFHPATAYVGIRSDYLARDYDKVKNAAYDVLPGGGCWAAEIADMGARAINMTGNRTNADRLLDKHTNRIGVRSGIDESWEVMIAQIRLNMRRHGKFAKRAVSMINKMQETGIEDPRLSYNLAMAKLREGDKEAEEQYLLDALKVDPTFRPAYEQLKKLEKLDENNQTNAQKAWPDFSL